MHAWAKDRLIGFMNHVGDINGWLFVSFEVGNIFNTCSYQQYRICMRQTHEVHRIPVEYIGHQSLRWEFRSVCFVVS